jgi:hypothetical protein
VAAELRARLGDRAAKVPRRTLPDLALRTMARVNPELRGVVPMLGRRYAHSSAKAQRLLGWAPRLPAETVIACAESLLDRGLT